MSTHSRISGMWKDILAFGLAGYLALILSIILSVLSIWRYHIKLRLLVRHVLIVDYKDNQSLVLFRLTFVNHALRGRVVVRTSIITPPGITAKQAEYQYLPNSESINCLLPNGEKSRLEFPSNEILQDALDIPPHQSRSRWRGVYLQWEIPSKKMEPISIGIVARDVNGKELARDCREITLTDSKNVRV